MIVGGRGIPGGSLVEAPADAIKAISGAFASATAPLGWAEMMVVERFGGGGGERLAENNLGGIKTSGGCSGAGPPGRA
jgi:hypothetical protein